MNVVRRAALLTPDDVFRRRTDELTTPSADATPSAVLVRALQGAPSSIEKSRARRSRKRDNLALMNRSVGRWLS